MKKTLLLMFLFPSVLFAQTPNWIWAKGVGAVFYERGYSISTDANGNSYVTGYFQSPTVTFGSTTLTNSGTTDFFITKYDALGNVLWAKSTGGADADQGYGIKIDISGNVFVTGTFVSPTITFGTTTLTNTSSAGDIFLVKYDSAGNVLWAKSAGGTLYDYSRAITADANGNVFITGYFDSPTITFGTTTLTNGIFPDVFIVKYDASGNLVWAKNSLGNSYDLGSSISADANGNSYVIGSFSGSPLTFGTTTLTNSGSVDVFVVKLDANGNFIWAKSAGGISWDYGYGISTDATGNSFVTGNFNSSTIAFGTTILTNAGSDDIFLAKYDVNGNVIWAKQQGGTLDDRGHSCTVNNSNIYLTGGFQSPTITFGTTTLNNLGGVDIFVTKYDALGNVLWSKSAAGNLDDSTTCISTDGIGNAFVAGYYDSPSLTFGSTTITNGGTDDFFIARLDNSTGIADEDYFSSQLFVSPNPSTGIFTVTSQEEITSIEIYNTLGELVFTSHLSHLTSEINLSSQAKGIYFIKVIADDKVSSQKIIIE